MCQNMFSSIPDVNRHSVKFIWEGKNREEEKKSSFYYRLIMRRNLNEWDLTKQRRLWLLLPSPFAACLPCTFLDDFTCEEVLIKVNKKKKRNFWMIFAFKILHKASRNFFCADSICRIILSKTGELEKEQEVEECCSEKK